MIFNTGRSFAYNQAPVIHRMLAEGKGHVRILIADGQQSFWEDEDVLHGNGVISEVHEIRLTLSKIRDIQKDLDSKCDKQTENGQKMSSLTKRIEIRKYKCVPQCSMFIFDDSYAWIIPYLPYQSSANLPAWRVDDGRGNLFQIYKAMYQDVWDRSIPIDNLDGEVEGLKKGEKVRSSSFR